MRYADLTPAGRPHKNNSGATMHPLGDDGKMKRALGLMSGTSMDGIDVALLTTDGQMQVERGPALSFGYTREQRAMIRQAIADAQLCKKSGDRPGRLAEIEREITELNGAAVSAFLRKQGIERDTIDLVGFHGQTVAHRPEDKVTVQLGDGTLLSELVRLPVVFDMRQQDVQSGGQGAPMASIYHQALAAKIDTQPVVVLNIGGVANVTWIGSNGDLLAFDTGPGNALIDDWMQLKTGDAFDAEGERAATGRVVQHVLDQLLDNSYFEDRPPKSLDRDHFKADAIADLSIADGAATLVEFTAQSIAGAQALFPVPAKTWLVTGGGRKNQHMMQRLHDHLSGTVQPVEDCGFDGDSVEAEAWAYMAVRAQLGLPLTFPGTTGVSEPQTGGTIAPWPKAP